jgi:hypothetical protein
VFYRYTVPGSVLVLGLLLALPADITNFDWSNNSLVIAVIIANIIIAGWTLYHAIYPIWRAFLKFVHIYPTATFLNPISVEIERAGKGGSLNAADLWSFYLWNQEKSTVRDRAKMLADYGHSLFLVALTFLLFPVAIVAAKSYLTEKIILELVFEIMLPSSDLIASEAILSISSMAIGLILLYYGRKRTVSAYNVQAILFEKNRDQVLSLIKNGLQKDRLD